MELVAVVVAFGLSAWLAARVIYAYGRLAGIKEAATEMAGGVGAACQRHGTPCTSGLKRCLVAIERTTVGLRSASKTALTVARALRDLGKEMGIAARQSGYEAGSEERERAKSDEIRIDLAPRDLLLVRWLAHAGFKLMMRNEAGGKFCFRDETDAQESNFALDRLERRLSQAHKDPTAPYALALTRQQLIWERWPHGNAAPANLQDAA